MPVAHYVPARSEPDHFYRTPESCTHALLDRERFGREIWEPSCGDGAIGRVLEARGHKVIASDLIDRGYGDGGRDFLQCAARQAESMVINPPFKLATEFTERALDLGCLKIAVFQRVAWLEGAERFERVFSRGKLARVHVFCRRQTLWRGDDPAPKATGGTIPFAWYIFDASHQGPASISWIPK